MVLTRGITFPHIKCAFSTLNDAGLIYINGEPFDDVSKKWKEYFESVKIPARSVHFMKQVHGDQFAEVDGTEPTVIINDVDALITRTKGVFVGAKAADCLLALVFDPVLGVVASVHSGWRGTSVTILKKVVTRLLETGSKKENIHVVLSPGINDCCYDVTGANDGRIETFEKLFGDRGVTKRGDRVFLNIRGANLLTLEQLGIPKSNIVNFDECTISGVLNLPSHYKNQTKERFVGAIGMI